jgi:glycosyltransferase involved in cell wall biosynthesis
MTADGRPVVSVVTVVRNDAAGLAGTLDSVARQNRSLLQQIVIDGGSTDDTRRVLDERRTDIEVLVSEPDDGIYSGMNKGLDRASCDWVLFLNAGDRFANDDAIERIVSATADDVDVIYSDVLFDAPGGPRLSVCDVRLRRFHHQAICYRRSLHDRFGRYVVGRGVTISDYIFLQSIAGLHWHKLPRPIAICDATGQSSRPKAYYQKLAIDLIFGTKGRVQVALMLLAYPFYRWLVRPVIDALPRRPYTP